MREGRLKNKDFTLKELLLINLYDKQAGKVNWGYLVHILIRIGLIMTSFYLSILSIHYAILANINFGIVSCCFLFSIVVNVSCAYLFFDEKLTAKMMAGILITIAGIVWISLAKGQSAQSVSTSIYSDDDRASFKLYSIILAVATGVFNASQTVQAKFMIKQRDYGILYITGDTITALALATSLVTLFNFL